MTHAAFTMSGIDVRFGGLRALDDVSLEVMPHRVVGVIGPNGAGKTTLFNVACGFIQPQSGRITWQGAELTRLRPHRLAGLGIGRTLQGLGLFDRMSVLDNVVVGADRHARAGFWSGLLALPRSGREERALRERAMTVLAELGVADHAHRLPPSLPYAIRKRVAWPGRSSRSRSCCCSTSPPAGCRTRRWPRSATSSAASRSGCR